MKRMIANFNIIWYTFFCLILLRGIISCENADVIETKNESNCKNETVIKEYFSEEGIIREIIIGPNSEGNNLDTIYAIQDASEKILVPSIDLKHELQRDSLKIEFSGNSTSCCNLITQPNYRSSF